MFLNEDIEVGFFIGFNCSRVIKLLEVILGKENDFYVKKIVFGWGIIGVVRSSNEEDVEIKSDIVCNRIVICEV